MLVKVGDVYHGLCCPGYDFTIAVIIVSAWGHCEGPHPGDKDDPYRQVKVFDMEDIELFVNGDNEAGPLTLALGAGGEVRERGNEDI